MTAERLDRNRATESPCFSICIPQYNRTKFLLRCIDSIQRQTFKNIEVCISDGGSTDGGTDEIEQHLRASGLRYVLARSDRNLQYDANLRKAIGLSSGRFVFLMGNDDEFADTTVLAYIAGLLEQHPRVVAVVSNYFELGTGQTFRRIPQTGVVGAGPECASGTFRHYAFVSGVIFSGPLARAAHTDAVDGGEMYQMYLGTHMVAAGGEFLGIDRICIHKDIQIPGEQVDSYRSRKKEPAWSIKPRPLPMGKILHTVWLGAKAGAGEAVAQGVAMRVARQLYLFTYPFWIFEYRKVQSMGYALGVYLALRPSATAQGVPLGPINRAALWARYLVVGSVAAVVPMFLFDWGRPMLYRLAKAHGKKPNRVESA